MSQGYSCKQRLWALCIYVCLLGFLLSEEPQVVLLGLCLRWTLAWCFSLEPCAHGRGSSDCSHVDAFPLFKGLHVWLWIIIFPQINTLITFRFLLILHLIQKEASLTHCICCYAVSKDAITVIATICNPRRRTRIQQG